MSSVENFLNRSYPRFASTTNYHRLQGIRTNTLAFWVILYTYPDMIIVRLFLHDHFNIQLIWNLKWREKHGSILRNSVTAEALATAPYSRAMIVCVIDVKKNVDPKNKKTV